LGSWKSNPPAGGSNLGRHKQRAVLTVLVLDANRPASIDRLVLLPALVCSR